MINAIAVPSLSLSGKVARSSLTQWSPFFKERSPKPHPKSFNSNCDAVDYCQVIPGAQPAL